MEFGRKSAMGPSVAAVVVAAGRGLRAGGDLPKQYRELAGEPVIRSSLSLFAWHGQIGAVQAVIHPDDRGSYEAAAKACGCCPGAGRRDAAGLGAGRPRGARARVRPTSCWCMTRRGRSARPNSFRAPSSPAAKPAPPSRRWRSPTRSSASMPAAMSRARSIARSLRAVQTPQAFAFPAAARGASPRRAAKAATISPTTPRWPNGRASRSQHFAGESGNVKLTTDEDFAQGRGAADREPRRSAPRQRLRRACLRRRRSCLARRHQDSARPRADRPFRRRRRACTRWSTRSSARSPTATSASISRRTIRAGAARRPISS